MLLYVVPQTELFRVDGPFLSGALFEKKKKTIYQKNNNKKTLLKSPYQQSNNLWVTSDRYDAG